MSTEDSDSGGSSYDPKNDDNSSIHSEENDDASIAGSQDVANDEFTISRQGNHRFDRKLWCIKYPGNVVNADKAIETLGGVAEISATADNKNRRMELRFRPDDGYCKPACGNRHQTAGFLLRVRVKKSRVAKVMNESEFNGKSCSQTETVNTNNSSLRDSNTSTKDTEDEPMHELADKIEKCSVESQPATDANNQSQVSEENKPPTFDRDKYENLSEDLGYQVPKLKILGRVETEFRFTNLCDFQYLPITKCKDDPSKDECIYEDIYPVGLPPYSWVKNKVPYFLPPAAFSRMDSVQQYVPKTELGSDDPKSNLVIGKTRKRRAGLSNYITFHTPGVPVNPPKGIETALKVKFLQSTHVDKMRELFDERPIWSKTAVMYVTKFTNEQLKVLLPAVAYYFMTGPWRITWARLGYDPRKDPASRVYQILDYRLKAMHGLSANITCKRNYSQYTLPYKNISNMKPKVMVLTKKPDLQQNQRKKKIMDENVYIYRPGMIPPSRQMFYQYCDVHVPEIKDMLDKYVGPPAGTPCHEKLGWLPVSFDDMCREIINKQVRAELRKLMNIPENHPTSLPRKRKKAPYSKLLKRCKTTKVERKPAAMKVEKQPAAMSILDDDDLVESEGEWENIPEEEYPSPSENEVESDNENEYDFDDSGKEHEPMDENDFGDRSED